MHHREPSLIADRVIAPDLGDVDLVLRGQTARDVHRTGRDVEVERSPGAAEMRPLRHRLEMVDGLGGFHLDRTEQLASFVGRREHEIRKDLHLADPDRDGLLVADIDRHVGATLQSHLQQPNDTVVLELLTDGAHQDRTHLASRGRRIGECGVLGTANCNVKLSARVRWISGFSAIPPLQLASSPVPQLPSSDSSDG